MPRGRTHRAGRPNDYDWELATGSGALPVATILQFEAFTSETAETLVRFRGDVVLWLDATGATIGDLVVIAYGVIRSASGSSDVGVSPITEGGANWLSYGIATLGVEEITQLGVDGLSMLRIEVDSKAMRKLRENESLYVVFESLNISGSPAGNVSFALRGLTAR